MISAFCGSALPFTRSEGVYNPGMNRLPMLLLVITFAAITAAQQPTPQPQRKSLKNPAEYTAYMSAIGQKDPTAKAQALESFLQQYPDTVMKEETLEQLMAAYGLAANQATNQVNTNTGALQGFVGSRGGIFGQKMVETANSLFYVNPDNLRAIAVLVYQKQASAKFLGPLDPQQVARLRFDAAELAKRGLRIIGNTPQPASMSDDAFAKYLSSLTTIFNGALPVSHDPLPAPAGASTQK